jgi:membrane protease YdiL (CAAX protease family)
VWSIRDAGLGLLLTPASIAVYVVGSSLVQLTHHWIFGNWTTGHGGREFFTHPSVMLIPFVFLNAFFEELIVRAYLMTEVFDLTRSSLLAVVVSVIVQFSYHLYYGWSGAISVSFLFLAFSLYFVRSRRALPIVVAHGIFDLIALIRLW